MNNLYELVLVGLECYLPNLAHVLTLGQNMEDPREGQHNKHGLASNPIHGVIYGLSLVYGSRLNFQFFCNLIDQACYKSNLEF